MNRFKKLTTVLGKSANVMNAELATGNAAGEDDYRKGREAAFGLNWTKVDGRRGIELLTKAANAGSNDAKAELAELYWNGCAGTPTDAERAYALALEAASSENPFALRVLGLCCKQGRGVAKNEKAAARYFKRALRGFKKRAANGDVRSKTTLMEMQYNGNGCAFDGDACFRWAREAAEAGSAEGMGNLGVCYGEGIGVERNDELAFEWLRKGAEAGDLSAMCNLGYYYEQGIAVEKNVELALEWRRKSAEAGDAWGMFWLGHYYGEGIVVEQDDEKAVEWLAKSAEAGVGEAMLRLGDCFLDGIGVERNEEKAVEWYRKSAEAGCAAATGRLAVCY
ncbi:MAG: sel1 repeat family protein, partial [Thermoguttaceae bacterium]|nr:sel1 repeat family protein [Thermoguttaceae bacterium]